MYIVGFNGPPQSGKDSLAIALAEKIELLHDIPIKIDWLSLPLRKIAYAMVDVPYTLYSYEGFKNEKFPQFDGATGRQLMIDVSESFLKKLYGIEVMAQMLIERNRDFNGLLLVPDCGFQIEVEPLIRFGTFGSFYLAQVYREGTSFENDSRERVYHPDTRMQSAFYNDGSLEQWVNTEATRLYGRLVNQAGWVF